MGWVLDVMWVLTAITLIFVFLRLYARICIVGTTGPDDYVYALSGVCATLWSLSLGGFH